MTAFGLCKRTIQFFLGVLCTVQCVFTFAATGALEGIQIYQKNLSFFAEHKKKLADDIDRFHHADNIWDALGSEFSLPHYEENPKVHEQIRWFLNNPDYLMRTAERAAPYLYYISQQARKRHLPAEVVLLPMIESAYNPFNYSSAGAAGIWQLMPGTASGFGVKQNWWYDGRRDVIASTNAALDYLVYLGGFFDGNWLLAIAAYDTGEGNILAAIRKNARRGNRTDFWSLPLSQETKAYVPRLLALAAIISNLENYDLEFPAVSNAPYLAQVDVGGQIDLKHAASLAGLSMKKLMQLNPGFNRTAMDPNGPYKIILPIENVAEFTKNLMSSPLYRETHWTRYAAKSGDTVDVIAKKFNTTPDTIRKMNALAKNTLKPGDQLLVPQVPSPISQKILNTRIVYAKESDAPVRSINTALKKIYSIQPGDTLYMVRRGDTLEKVASHFHLSIGSLLYANHFEKPRTLIYGEQLIVPTHKAPHQKYLLSPGDTIYMVRNGDTLEKIAYKFHTDPSAIRVANLMFNSQIAEGDRLIVPSHG